MPLLIGLLLLTPDHAGKLLAPSYVDRFAHLDEDAGYFSQPEALIGHWTLVVVRGHRDPDAWSDFDFHPDGHQGPRFGADGSSILSWNVWWSEHGDMLVLEGCFHRYRFSYGVRGDRLFLVDTRDRRKRYEYRRTSKTPNDIGRL